MKKLLPLLVLLLALATAASGETLTLSFVGDCSIGEMTTAQNLLYQNAPALRLRLALFSGAGLSGSG